MTSKKNPAYHGMTKAEFERRERVRKAGPFYKVLQRWDDGTLHSCSGGYKTWGKPADALPGPWEVFTGTVHICTSGLHATNNPTKWQAELEDHETFEVDIPWYEKDVQITDVHSDEKIAVSKLRLIRPIDPHKLATFGIVRGDVDISGYRFAESVEDVYVQKGAMDYNYGRPMRFKVSNNAKVCVATNSTVFSYGESSVEANHATVYHNSTGSLGAGADSTCYVAATASVVARPGSIVIVNAGAPRIYAESGSTIILNTAAHVFKASNSVGVAIINPDRVLKQNKHFVVLTARNEFHSFAKLPDGIPSDAKIIL